MLSKNNSILLLDFHISFNFFISLFSYIINYLQVGNSRRGSNSPPPSISMNVRSYPEIQNEQVSKYDFHPISIARRRQIVGLRCSCRRCRLQFIRFYRSLYQTYGDYQIYFSSFLKSVVSNR